MSVDIKRISDEEITVNGKVVYKDHNEQWIGRNLNTLETKAFNEYIIALEKFNKQKRVNESTRS